MPLKEDGLGESLRTLAICDADQNHALVKEPLLSCTSVDNKTRGRALPSSQANFGNLNLLPALGLSLYLGRSCQDVCYSGPFQTVSLCLTLFVLGTCLETPLIQPCCFTCEAGIVSASTVSCCHPVRTVCFCRFRAHSEFSFTSALSSWNI